MGNPNNIEGKSDERNSCILWTRRIVLKSEDPTHEKLDIKLYVCTNDLNLNRGNKLPDLNNLK